MIWQIFKVIIMVLFLLFIIGLTFWLVLLAGWPWWVGLFILLGLLGMVLMLAFTQRLLLRRREQRFVQQVIEQDELHYRGLPEKEKEGMKGLQSQWKEAIEALKKSHLKKYGNPLYILPWYVVLGESGSGKTTALQSARLSSPFVEVRKTSGISGTRNCDWWFFENAIILDTAGRYAIPIDEGRDKDEWQKFLRLLSKFRKKEPINGLVITMAADKLSSAGIEELEEDGRNIRHRIDELMRSLGAKFPIYVLITKCDLVQGIARFCDNLSEETLGQAMGMINQDLSKDVTSITQKIIEHLVQRLRDLRLLVFHKSKPKAPDPELLLFPEEFERLQPGLNAFMRVAFQENPYQETPFLRGIFFSSGKQEGSPYSHFLKELGLIHERELLQGTSRGFFLHDFFSGILPTDRHLFKPTLGLLEWRRLTRNLGLLAWIAIAVAFCGLLSFSFAKNLMIMREVAKEVSKPVVSQNDLVADIIRMDQFRQVLLKVEEQNRGWWIPRFGLRESIRIEKELKARFGGRFREGFLKPYHERMAGAIIGFTTDTAEDVTGAYIAQLVRRINLIQGRLENKKIETLKGKPLPTYERTLQTLGQEVIPEVGQKIAGLYFDYILWTEDADILTQEKAQLQTWLNHILTLEKSNLNWMAAWINRNQGLTALRLEDFWGGSLTAKDATWIEPAFTLKGMNALQSFIKEIEEALTDPVVIAGNKLTFQDWYRKEYFHTWNVFGRSFPRGADGLNDKTEWRQMASIMGTEANPYFKLFDRIVEEMKPFSEHSGLPSWVQSVYAFKDTSGKASLLQKKSDEKAGIMQKATTSLGSTITKIEEKTGINTDGLESKLKAAQALRDFKDALSQIVIAVTSRDTAFQTATAIYSDDPSTSQTPYFVARRAFSQFQVSLGGSKPDQELFWNLVKGPLDFLLTFVSRESACQLQNIWEKDVLMEVQGETDMNILIQDLLGKDGFARKFVMGTAKPFIATSLKRGFYAKNIDGQTIPFDNYFFIFLNKGAQSVRPARASYSVTIHGEPTGANKEAAIIPHATELEMQCADKTYQLVNLNYPVRETVNWSPANCGDVVFKIKVSNLILTKNYTGNLAFAKFLKDFEKGTRIFYPHEFPEQEAELKRMQIQSIIARYRFDQHKPVIQFLQAGPGRVPEEIVACWDQ
ncbi:MAG: type VI secretion system protein ImpL [Deltaproteobacteria bacterium]|nr:type VI secretion system protein ImpL [Deltaproteobacteria bacterium]